MLKKILILVMITNINVYGLGHEQKSLLDKISAFNRINKSLLQSFSACYESQIRLDDGSGGEEIILKKGTLAFKGSKIFSKEINQDNTELLFIKNENKLSIKTTQTDGVPVIGIGTEHISNIRPGSPDPWNLIDNGLSLGINKLDQSIGIVKSVERIKEQDRVLIQVEIIRMEKDVNGGNIEVPILLFYCPESNYIPVKMIAGFEHSSGIFYEEAQVSDIKKIDFNGTELYIPCESFRKVFFYGVKSQSRHYAIDKDTIQINPDIPDSMFVMEIGPNDQVINLDLNLELQGPGGRDLLVENIELDTLKNDSKIPNNTIDSVILDTDIQIRLVDIPAGNFIMGSPEDEIGYPESIIAILKSKDKPLSPVNEYPQRKKDVEAFRMSETEITIQQFKVFQPNYKPVPYEELNQYKNDYPATVTWYQANAFCEWLSKKTGLTVRLPKEVEWEYACRAGRQTRFFWGDDETKAGKYANIADLSYQNRWPDRLNTIKTDDGSAWITSVKTYKPNDFGLYDMLGNVAEWCYDDYVKSEKYIDSGNIQKVHRGGGASSDITSCRCASRQGANPKDPTTFIGFRIVVEIY